MLITASLSKNMFICLFIRIIDPTCSVMPT